jgi:hypothetical protein
MIHNFGTHSPNISMVPGSIPGGVTGFFSDVSPSDRTMALGSTQPLVKVSIRNIPGGKGGRCVRLTTSPPSRAECHEIWEPKPTGNLWVTPVLLRDPFIFISLGNCSIWNTGRYCEDYVVNAENSDCRVYVIADGSVPF